MKKTLTLLAILAAIGPAWGADVVSSNIVGYNKVTLNEGLNLLSAQFVPVGADGSLSLEDITSLTGEASFDEDFAAQTTLRFFTGSGYEYYGWSGNLTTENPDLAEALADEQELDDASVLNNKWLDSSYEIASDPVDIGSGFWLYAKTASGVFTVSGEVPGDDPVTANLVAGLNLVSYPWPMACDLSKITVSGQPSYDEDFSPQTTIRVFTGSGYEYYGWSGNLTAENPDLAEALAEEQELADASVLNNKWLDSSYEIVKTPIEIGKGFWIYAANAGKVTYEK